MTWRRARAPTALRCPRWDRGGATQNLAGRVTLSASQICQRSDRPPFPWTWNSSACLPQNKQREQVARFTENGMRSRETRTDIQGRVMHGASPSVCTADT